MRWKQLRQVDLNLLVAFSVFAEELNITAAANRLFLSQSAASRTLQRLQALFDDDLLVRGANGYQLTPAGARLQSELNRLLRALGITTIYVTHDQAEAMELGDRIVVMQKGAIAQIGTPREIYFTPKSRFVAEFIGAANIIESSVEDGHLVLPGGHQPIGGNDCMKSVIAMVRPETIGIVEAAIAPLSGIIDSVSFMGDRQRIIVREAANRSLVIDAPNTIGVEEVWFTVPSNQAAGDWAFFFNRGSCPDGSGQSSCAGPGRVSFSSPYATLPVR